MQCQSPCQQENKKNENEEHPRTPSHRHGKKKRTRSTTAARENIHSVGLDAEVRGSLHDPPPKIF